MSNTSAALENARLFKSHAPAMRRWLLLAVEHLPKDIILPGHIIPSAGILLPNHLALQCLRCTKAIRVDSVAAAADFRDQHWHCGEVRCDAWRCPTCDNWEFEFQTICRFCHVMRDMPATANLEVAFILNQYVSYDIFLPGRRWRAQLTCNSLLRAKRAARAMYPRCVAEVRCDFGSWNAEA